MHAGSAPSKGDDRDPDRPSLVFDPVCGMSVSPATAKHSASFSGDVYYFCNPRCRARFEAEPTKFVAPRVAAPVPEPPPGALYVCPMDPEVRERKPGACPKCGMALEPFVATGEDGLGPELVGMKRRLWVASALTFPVFALGMAEMLPGSFVDSWLPHRLQSLVAFVFSTPVVLWAGKPFFERAWASLKNGSTNMFTLVSLGSGAAFLYSVAATIAPELFPASARDHHGEVGVYFEAAAVIVTLVLFGQVIELGARCQTRGAVRALLGLVPKTARRVTESGEEDILIEALRRGDRVRIRPGERVPGDGIVLDGSSACDESMITGESLPAPKQPGARVTGGTTNGNGSLLVAIDRVGETSFLAQIVRLVTEAQRTRAPVQELVDRVSSFFVPAVIAASLVTFGVWSLVGPEPRLSSALANAVAVLIVACPCALGLATPMSIYVAVGRGARAGVLFKTADALTRLGRVTTLALDKTGTLTEGRPTVVTVRAFGSFSEDDVLAWAAALEARGEHPLGAAIVAAAKTRAGGVVAAVEAIAGEGIVGSVDAKRVAVGNEKLLARLGILLPATADLEALRSAGETVAAVVIGDALAGIVGIADRLKDTSPEAVRALREDGVALLVLSGDDPVTARQVAKRAGVDDVVAGISPAEKAATIARLQEKGELVAMAGDGINDAPALARADVGIAMGTGTDVAIQSASITLVEGDLRAIVRARRLSKATMANIRQNLALSFGYNLLGVPIAAGVFYPLFGLTLNPMVAAAAMSLSSVSVIANALRLRSLRL